MIRLRTAWLALTLVASAGLGWQQVRWRHAPEPPPAAAAPQSHVDTPLDASALTLAFAMAGGAQVPTSTEPLRLRALIVASHGPARALIDAAGAQRSYQVGDRLPGGNLIRHIDARQVLLWRAGREERLLFVAPTQLFSPIPSSTVVRP